MKGLISRGRGAAHVEASPSLEDEHPPPSRWPSREPWLGPRQGSGGRGEWAWLGIRIPLGKPAGELACGSLWRLSSLNLNYFAIPDLSLFLYSFFVNKRETRAADSLEFTLCLGGKWPSFSSFPGSASQRPLLFDFLRK